MKASSIIVAMASWCVSSLALAQATPAAPVEQYHWQPGPKTVDLGHEIEMRLPANRIFLGMPDADRLLKKSGNFNNQNVLGLVIGNTERDKWLVVLEYQEDGHINDDEKLDAGKILKAIREGTEEANKERVEKGFDALSIGDWTELPMYDRGHHHLVWALPVSDKNGTSINYNTRVLGRRGYVSLNLVSDNIAADKPIAAELLGVTGFKAGARYEDFDKKKGDKVAEYGLMGLILGGAGLGVAAKIVKIGLIAKFWKVILGVLIAGKKLVIAFFVLIGAGIKRIFGKKSEPPTASAPTDVSQRLPPTGTDDPPPPSSSG